MDRTRRCEKGKPCGATCITRSKICRMDLMSEMSDDMGKVRNSIQPKSSNEVKSKPQADANEKFQKDFVEHVNNNSASFSNATFKPSDLANLVVQASNELDGEAKDNLKKLMEWVVKDNQVLFVSTREVPKDSRDIKTVRKFAALLDQSYPALKLDFEKKISRIQEMKAERREKVLADRQRKAEGLPPLWRERIARIDRDIKNLGKELKEARQTIFSNNITYSVKEGNWGFTSEKSRRVVVMDRSSIPTDRFVKGEGVDVKLIAKQIQDTMEFREKTPKLTDDEMYKTKFVVGRFADGSTTNAYLHVYIHELGHQVQHRSESKVPPNDSSSLKRGSTIYSTNQGISHYSRVNSEEAFAEAFSAFILNPKALKQQDEPLYNWVRSSFETAIENAGAPTLM